jgi:RHS repeat-associated protein
LWKVNYDYGTTDNNGNVRSQQITVPNQFVANQVYTYDSLNRLKSARETISNAETWKQTFTFDRYGNRKFDASQTTTLGNCPANVCNPDINPANNRVVGANFDNAGNTTQDAEGRQFFYDGENKQKEVKNAQNQVIGQYLYDGDGKRIKKLAANDTTIFVYDASGKLAAEYAITTSQTQAPQTSYLTNDTLGSPRVTTDSSGNVVSRRDFRPYGEEIARANQGTDKIRQKFTSYERDNETELDFAQARFYNSKTGRFNTVDPLMASADIINPQTFNRYIYVGNNPVNITDPTGEIWGINGNTIQWFADNAAMIAAGFTASNIFIGTNAVGQTVVFNNTSAIPVVVSDAAAGVQQIIKWVAAGAISSEAAILSAGSVGITLTGIALDAEVNRITKGRMSACPVRAPGCAGLNIWENIKRGYGLEMSDAELEELVPEVRNISEEAAQDSTNTENNEVDTSASGGSDKNSGGGKTGRKINQDRLASAKKLEAEAKAKLDVLKSKPNKTKQDKKDMQKLENEIRKQRDRQKKSEVHFN